MKISSRKIFQHKDKAIKSFLSVLLVVGLILNGFVTIFSVSHPASVEAADTTHKRIEAFPASGTFTVPAGVTSAIFEGWGGGGGGDTGAGSGGGGAYKKATVAVSAGQEYVITVGAGGAVGGSNGGDTTVFRDPTTHLRAEGGKGGGANGGTGGTEAGDEGDSGFNGGDGVTASGTRAGGGGAGDEASASLTVPGNFFGGIGANNFSSRFYGSGGASSDAAEIAGFSGFAKVTYDLNVDVGYPVIKSYNWGRTNSDNNHTIRMPSGITVGDLLIIIFSADGPDAGAGSDHTIGVDWTEIDRDSGAQNTGSIFYKIAEGSDAATIATDAIEEAAHITLRIANGGIPTSNSANGSSTNGNPPSHDAGDTAKYLWIAAMSKDSSATETVIPDAPSGYEDFIYLHSGANITAGVDVWMATLHEESADGIEDPGTFASINEQWAAFTIAVPYDDNDAPLVTDFTPDDNATDVAIDANLVITFDEAVDAESGNINLYETVGDVLVEAFDVTTDITGTGTITITANPTSDLSNDTNYYVKIDATAFDDAASNSYAGIADETTWNFTTVAGGDTTAPIFSSVTPAASSSINSVTTSSDVGYTIDEALAATTGIITITQTGGTADGNSPHTCTLTGTALNSGAHTIDLSDTTNGCTVDTSNLVSGSIYTFTFDGEDAAGNPATTVTRNSVTFDNTVPVFSSVLPNSSSSINNVTSSSDIEYSLSESVSSGTVVATRTSGTTDDNSPHTCNLAGTALNSGAHTLNLSDTTNGCGSDVSNLVSGTVYTFAFNATDAAGNTATEVSRTSVTFDTTAPTITSVSSDKVAGSYTVDELIDIDVTFSEVVTSTGDATVTLETGVTDRTCTIAPSGESTKSCNYTVQTGDTSSDLDATISGTIADAAGNAMSNFTPTTGLAANEALVIDTTAPSAPGTPNMTDATDSGASNSDNITSDTTPDFVISCESGATVYLREGSNALGNDTCSSSTVTITSSTLTSGNYSVYARQTDVAGNTSSDSSALSVTTDTDVPVFSSVTPSASSSIDNVTSSSDIAYTLDTAVASGQVVATRTSGTTDANSPHTCTLAGTALNSGAHTLNLSDTTNSCASDVSNLVVDTVYTFTFDATDVAGNTAVQVSRTSVTFIDGTPPVRSAGSPSGALSAGTTGATLSLTTDESATCKYDTVASTAYGDMDNTFTTTGTTSHSESITGLSDGNTYTYYVRCTDGSSNANTDDYTITFSVDSASSSGVSSSGSRRTRFVAPTLSLTPLTPLVLPFIPLPESIDTPVKNVIDFFENIFPRPVVETPAETPPEELIPKETPLVFQGRWQLLPQEEINSFVLAPLPRAITNLAGKFPRLGETFEEVGIDKITDVAKLKTVKFSLPGLTERVAGGTEEELGLPQGVPVGELTSIMKERIPTEIVFAKGGSELIDYNMSLSISEEGQPEQKINTIVGRPIHLVIRPGEGVKSVKGYIVWKGKVDSDTSLELPSDSLLSSIIFAEKVFAQVQERPVRVEEKLVLLEFEYTDPDGDGIYTAEIEAPAVGGEYEIITVLEFNDPELGRKEVRLTTVVDPEGYIYEKYGDKEIRVPGAIASIYWLNPATSKYVLWPAEEYQQENPQTTNLTGSYSFLVPEGSYYLRVEASGYTSYEGKPFQVTEGSGVHNNIELKTKYWWFQILDWKTIILLAIIIMLSYNFFRDKKRG